jgi:hypothetical protein
MLEAMRRTLLLVTLAASLFACANSDKASAPRAAPEPQATALAANAAPIAPLAETKFGAAITESTTTPLAKIVSEPASFAGKTVRTEGVVTSVCQTKGCWMQISDDTGAAHVKFAGYGFFVPKNASGHRAVIQGQILPSKDNTCSSKDGCREAGEKASGVVAKVDFEATGVQFLN